MKLTRLLTGLAAALATAMFIGLAAPAAVAQDNPAPPRRQLRPPPLPRRPLPRRRPPLRLRRAAPAAPAAPPSCSATVTRKVHRSIPATRPGF